jgi:Holliday junction resolvasome RuvABC endonuclease subunit
MGRGCEYLTSDTVDLEKIVGAGKELAWSRVGELYVQTKALIATTLPDIVACETPRPNRRNQDTNRKMGGCYGAVAIAAYVCDKPFMEIQPDAVRRTGYHKRAQKRTAKAFGIPVDEMTPDRADAIGGWSIGGWSHAWGLRKERWLETEENADYWRKLVEG